MASLLFSLGKELLGNALFDSVGGAVEKKDFGKTLLDTITNPFSYIPGGRIIQDIAKGVGMRNKVKG